MYWSVDFKLAVWYRFDVKLRFTDHAKYRLFMERGISVESVKAVIMKPDGISRLADGVVKSVKRLENGNLVVVYKNYKGVYMIITAYFK